MNKLKNYFGNYEITIKRLIILTLLCGTIPGILLRIPALENSSFTNPGVCYEFWVMAALFIITNCKSYKEACIKTFLFFLVSQPLIYIIQLPFNGFDTSILRYYTYWIIPTILTIPGSFMAYRCKKGDWLSFIIFMICLFLLGLELASHIFSCIKYFPKQILSIIFILFEVIFFTELFFKDKLKKIILYVFCILVALGSYYYYTVILKTSASYPLEEGYSYEMIEHGDGDFELYDSDIQISSNFTTYAKLRRNDGAIVDVDYICDTEMCNIKITVEENNTNTNNEVTNSMKLLINDNEYTIVFEDNETASTLYGLLPLELTMNELNGNEKYAYLDSSLPANSFNPGTINKGDVMLYGDNCLVIFYETFETSYSYTRIGHIDNLPDLGNDNINVKIYN